MEMRNVYDILVRKLEGKMLSRKEMSRLKENIGTHLKYVGRKFLG
jgi:hypothetical protein